MIAKVHIRVPITITDEFLVIEEKEDYFLFDQLANFFVTVPTSNATLEHATKCFIGKV